MGTTVSAIALSLYLLGMQVHADDGDRRNSRISDTPVLPSDPAKQVHLVHQTPTTIVEVEPGVFLVDFEKVAFGNIELQTPSGTSRNIRVHFGEDFRKGRINRTPPGSVRYTTTEVVLEGGTSRVIAPAPDKRNTEAASKDHPPAVLTPKDWGVVLPFRWVEIEGWQGKLQPKHIKRRAAFAKTWDDNAVSFHCSDPMINQVWELCRYSIKATTFAGIFVDGDRERIPYEADAYLNQLSYYTTSTDNKMVRTTFDHLMNHGTWPTEWAHHMVFMAYADWMRTGDKAWLAERYDALKTKLHMNRVGVDGLIHSAKKDIEWNDIVDWPVGERDGFQFGPLNAVINSFHLRSLKLMSIMGKQLGRNTDADQFATLESKANDSFQKLFFDPQKGLYRDGAGINHHSLHANLFPLAFNQIPEAHRDSVARWLVSRGMRCSVYASQYLLEGLFENGQDSGAIDLMIAPGDRSWRNMVESGATITWEAWDQRYKPNQDWNHAWGAAPANVLPRYVLGVQAQTPGWSKVVIKPHLGSLEFARGKVPTPLGPIIVDWNRKKIFTLSLKLPKGMFARVELPVQPNTTKVLVNGKSVKAARKSTSWILGDEISGSAKIELK